MRSSDSSLASCSGVAPSGFTWFSEGSGVLCGFGELLGVLGAGSGSLFSPPLTDIGSSLPGPFLPLPTRPLPFAP